MTIKEFGMLMKGLESNYRQLSVTGDEMVFNMWFANLGDLDYKTASMGITKLMQEFSYAPTIADIRKYCSKVSKGEVKDASKAWEEVTRAIRTHGSYNVERALNSMSKDVRGIVKSIGFREICLSEDLMVERAHFMKMYKEISEREEKSRQLSLPLQENIKQLQIENGVIAIDEGEKQKQLAQAAFKQLCANTKMPQEDEKKAQPKLDSINEMRKLFGKQPVSSLDELK